MGHRARRHTCRSTSRPRHRRNLSLVLIRNLALVLLHNLALVLVRILALVLIRNLGLVLARSLGLVLVHSLGPVLGVVDVVEGQVLVGCLAVRWALGGLATMGKAC